MECLDKVIKLSRTECNCFDDNKPEDYSEGKSDVYLDELEGLNLSLIEASSDCANGSLWDLMSKSRENATKQFKADLLGCINTNYTNRRQKYAGIVGSVQFTQTLNYTENTSGAVLLPYKIVGGYMRIKKLGLMFSQAGTFNVSIYSNEDLDNPIATYPVTYSTANSLEYVVLSTPLKLPMWSNEVSTLEYYAVYDLIGTYKPKNNKNCSGCGQTESNRPYSNWLRIAGIKGNNTTPFNEFTRTTELNGLVFDIEFLCESSRIICSEESPLDFENDGRAMQIAYAIRFKAGELLIESILSSGNINRYTMMDREALYGKRNRYRKLYEDWLAYLCEHTDVTNNDCLVCRPNPNFVKGGIFA